MINVAVVLEHARERISDFTFPPGIETLPLGGGASNLQAGEILKIERGQITAVEAMGASLPYGTLSGWGE